MEISSFLSTSPQGMECGVAPANASLRDALEDDGTEALAAGFAALFQLMMAPASPGIDPAPASSETPSAVEATPPSGSVALPPIAGGATTSAQSLPSAGLPEETAEAPLSAPARGASPAAAPLFSNKAELDGGESPAPSAATPPADELASLESVAEPTTNRVAEAPVPAAAESEPEAPARPQPADLFLNERQAEPAATAPVPSETASSAIVAIPTIPSDTTPTEAAPSANPVTATPGSDVAVPPDVGVNPAFVAPPIAAGEQEGEAAAAGPSAPRAVAPANSSSISPPAVAVASATASPSPQPAPAPAAVPAPQPATPGVVAATEWHANRPETAVDDVGSELEPLKERASEAPEPESWLDALTAGGQDGMLTIQELAAWQTFGRESSFDQSRQQTQDDPFASGPVRKTADSTPQALDSMAAAIAGAPSREPDAAAPAVIARDAVPSFAVEEIVSHVRTEESDGVSRVEAQIDPPELGRMWIEITKSAEGVKAHLTVEDPAVWNLLETAATEMRQSLQDSGVPMAGLTLSLGRDGGSSPSGGHAGDPHGESRRDEDSYATVTGAAQRRARPKRQVDTIV